MDHDISLPAPTTFVPTVAEELRRGGWLIVDLPGGLMLSVLRASGAPFRGERFFRDFAPFVVETATLDTQVAYQPGLLAGSLNLRYEAAELLVAEFGRGAPTGVRATIGTAATYVQIIWAHARTTGDFPLRGYYTWTADAGPDGHLVVGVFGRDRPIVVGPHPKSGAGIGVMPLLVPDDRPE